MSGLTVSGVNGCARPGPGGEIIARAAQRRYNQAQQYRLEAAGTGTET